MFPARFRSMGTQRGYAVLVKGGGGGCGRVGGGGIGGAGQAGASSDGSKVALASMGWVIVTAESEFGLSCSESEGTSEMTTLMIVVVLTTQRL
jgi:hypothetical protein